MRGSPSPEGLTCLELAEEQAGDVEAKVGCLRNTMGRSDSLKTNPESVALLIRRLLPEAPSRLRVLQFLGNSVNLAHNENHESWGLRAAAGLLRLNVGNIEVITIFPRLIHIVLDGSTIPEDLRTKPGINWDQAGRGKSLYKSVASSVACDFSPRLSRVVLPLVRDSHIKLLSCAAETRRHPRTLVGHSEAAVIAISKVIGCMLPQPGYVQRVGGHGSQPRPQPDGTAGAAPRG